MPILEKFKLCLTLKEKRFQNRTIQKKNQEMEDRKLQKKKKQW
jgi:hypothetical protein